MATYAQVTAAIAAQLKSALTVGTAHATPPSTLTVNSAVVVPAPEWGNWETGTFTDPDVSFEVVLIAPTADYVAAFAWFHDRLTEIATAFNADKTLGGLVDGCIPMTWRQPERVQVAGSGQDAIAVYVQLAPMRLNN